MSITNIPFLEGASDDLIPALLSWAHVPQPMKFCTVTGGAGAGKSHMLAELYKTMWEMHDTGMLNADVFEFCSTTHRSVTVLEGMMRPMATLLGRKPEEVRTLHSILSLVPANKTLCLRYGNKKLNYSDVAKAVTTNTYAGNHFGPDNTVRILICDESNWLPKAALDIIECYHPNTRIIFVGSENQIGSDNNGVSPVYTKGYPNYLLNTKWRALGNPDMQTIYDQVEQDVIHKNPVSYFPPENTAIKYFKEDNWLATMKALFESEHAQESIVLAWTNKRVAELVLHIRQLQGRSGLFDISGKRQVLVSSSPLIPKYNPKIIHYKGGLAIEVKTHAKNPKTYYSLLGNSYAEYEALCNNHTAAVARDSNLIRPSLVASCEAMTVASAMGTTCNFALLDLPNINMSAARTPELHRRMWNVAHSRAKIKNFALIS